MQRLRIKTRKDWFIAFVFTFLLVYLLVLRYQVVINDWLLRVTPGKISYFNQPEEQGVFAVTVLAVAVISIGVMIYKKVKGKYITLALAGGIIIAAAIMATYYYECRLLLKVPLESEPESVRVSEERNGSHISYTLNQEMEEQIVEKIMALEPLSDQDDIRRETINGSTDRTSISIWYPRRNDYSYHIMISVKNKIIYFAKGHGLESVIFYQDNGLLDILEELRDEGQKPTSRT